MKVESRNKQISLVFPKSSPSLKGPKITVFVAIAVFFGAITAWSLLAPLSSAVIAQGRIAPQGETKTIRHPDGGVVAAILAQNGQEVEKGQIVIQLSDVSIKSQLSQNLNKYYSLVIRSSRLEAERLGLTIWLPSRHLEHVRDRLLVKNIINDEKERFELRLMSYRKRVAIYDTQLHQQQIMIDGLENQLVAVDAQLNLIRKEHQNVSALVAKGLERLPRLLSLERAMYQITERKEEIFTRIADSKKKKEDLELRKLAINVARKEEASKEISEVTIEKASTEEKIKSEKDRLSRSSIRSPVKGTVANLKVSTTGSSIGRNEELFEIVPRDAKLMANVRIPPKDVEEVYPGQDVEVLVQSFPQRDTPQINGVLHSLSADLSRDNTSGQEYYAAEVHFQATGGTPSNLEKRLMAGMPVSAYLKTGEQTLWDYLVSPILFYLERAFRET